MEEAEEEIYLRSQALTNEIQTYNPDEIDETDIDDKIYLAKLEELDRLQKDVMGRVDKFLHKFPHTDKRQYFEDLNRKTLSSVSKHKQLIKVKVAVVKRNMTSNETASISHSHSGGDSDLKRREVEAMEKANKIAELQVVEAKKIERQKSISKAKSLFDDIREDIVKLDEKITEIDVDEWPEEDDNSVSKGMRKLDKWEADMEKIILMFRKLKDLKNVNHIEENEVRCEFLESEVKDLEEAFKEIKEKIETEDEDRGLYSMETAKTTQVSLPIFSGKDSEDFSKFKLDMEDGFKTNRISKKEQIKKLRECVKGQARKLIPDSNVTDVAHAWEILKKAYGNPIRIIKQRKEALLKLGVMPSDKLKGELDNRAQVSWFIDVTTFLKELIDLGKKNPEYKDVAFSKEFVAQIRLTFPRSLYNKLRKCKGEGQELFENMLDKIEEFREAAQEVQQDLDITKPIACQFPRSGVHFTENAFQESDEESSDDEASIMKSILVAYKPPRRDEKCRVCRQLDKEGDTEELYDDHLHNYPSGCPRYIQMDIKERNRICYEAKICMKCHNPEYVYKLDDIDHLSVCKPTSYTCKNSNCDFHMWVCTRHKTENKVALEEYKLKYENDYKLDFGFVVTIGSLYGHINPESAKRKKLQSRSPQSPGKVKRKIRADVTVAKVLNDKGDSIINRGLNERDSNNNKTKSGKNVKRSSRKSQPPSLKRISSKVATQILKRKLSQDGDSAVELKPVPKGRAQFMIGQTKGRTGPLNILYDSGCCTLLLKEGTQRELGRSVLKTKGPFYVNGVGNTKVKVNDEWLTSLSLVDGSRQVVEGWTVDEVTGNVPKIDLTEAVNELKNDDQNNSKLQSMFVELVAGGQIDILLGTMYNAIFPKFVHSLPSGLTIYELQVSSHDGRVNSVIGGPHESFEKIVEQTDGLCSYNIVISNLMQSLENYRNFGAPSLPRSLIMSEQEEDFCKASKESEKSNYDKISEGVYDDLDVEVKVDGLISEDVRCNENSRPDNILGAALEVKGKSNFVFSERCEKSETNRVKLIFRGTFIENYCEILENLDKLIKVDTVVNVQNLDNDIQNKSVPDARVEILDEKQGDADGKVLDVMNTKSSESAECLLDIYKWFTRPWVLLMCLLYLYFLYYLKNTLTCSIWCMQFVYISQFLAIIKKLVEFLRNFMWSVGKAELKIGDIVYFRKQDNELSSKWTVGKVTEVVKSKDGSVRRCIVQYKNSPEDISYYTARSLLKLFNIDDASWQENFDLVEKLIKEVDDKKKNVVKKYTMDALKFRMKAVGDHDPPQREVGVQLRAKARIARSWMECEDYEVELLDNMPVVEDELVSILYAINTDFDMDKSDDCEKELFASAD